MLCRELEPQSELQGAIRDGKVFGLAASNMKSGLAAFMVAGKALKKSGAPLKGDLILAAVAGEISRTPIGPYQSGLYRGEGTGTRHLLTYGVQSDYAIVAGPLGPVHHLDPGRRRPVQDRHLRQPPRGLGRHPEAGAARGAQRGAQDGQRGAGGGRLGRGVRGQPRLPVRQRADHPQGPTSARFRGRSLPAQLPPGHLLPLRGRAHPAGAAPHRGAAPVARGHGRHRLRVRHRDVHLQDGLRGQGHRARGGGHREHAPRSCSARRPPRPIPFRSSIWTDTNIYNEMGIPACKFGLGGGRWTTRSEQIDIDEIVRAAKIYALSAADRLQLEPVVSCLTTSADETGRQRFPGPETKWNPYSLKRSSTA